MTITRTLPYISLLVPDYDDAIRFFTQVLRFALLQDTRLSDTKRWVVVAPDADGAGDASGDGGTRGGALLLLARASTPEQQALVGRQGGGRVWLFLHTSDIDADIAHLLAHGVRFVEEQPRHEAYGRVIVFEDIWGNRWDLIEPAAGS